MKKQKRTGIILQICLTALLGMLFISVFTYASQRKIVDSSIKEGSENIARQTADQALSSIRQFPTFHWLLKYWYEHADEMEIEYDTDYSSSIQAKQQLNTLTAHQPDLHFPYTSEQQLLSLPSEDQKLFAEVAYNWITTDLNRIKRGMNTDHLYCVVTDVDGSEHPYETQFFLLSASEPDSVRSDNDVFPLGKVIHVPRNRTLQDSMRQVVLASDSEKGHFEYSGNFADYYAFLDSFENHAVLVGVSYSKTMMEETILKQARAGTWNAFIYEALLVALILNALFLYMIHPLTKVLEIIRNYTENKDSADANKKLSAITENYRAFMVRNNEIGQLCQDFSGLTTEIDSYIKEIGEMTAKTERISTELRLAENLQASMLPNVFPPFPERREFDIYASMDPAIEVGGDFYDFFFMDEDHLCLVIADVSGKGIAGALFMMLGKLTLRSSAQVLSSPADILENANNAICDNNKNDMFITIWIGILELSTGILTASNAGHEYPALQKPGRPFELLKDRHHMVAGSFYDTKYKNYTLQLEPGTKLFVYTDGVPESTNSEKELFGTGRMLDALNGSKADDPKSLILSVTDSINAFVGEADQFDDITMMCIEYHGPRN